MKMLRFFTLGMLLVAWALEPALSLHPALAATTWVVNTLSDVAAGDCSHGSCSLRDAIAFAMSGDTITFSVTGTIYLNHGGLTIDKNLTISGPGAASLTITGVGLYQVFHISVGKSVTLSGLTITFGRNSNGGGIYNEGVLVLNQCTISDHTATEEGGGLYNKGTATVNRSTFIDNHATNYGGGIKNEGGALSITNSTFTLNGANSRGGAIDNDSNSSLAVMNCTFKGNGAIIGGGIGDLSGVSTVKNVLMAGNGGGNCNGQFAVSSTHNLSTDDTCSPGFTQVLLEDLALGDLSSNPVYFPLNLGSSAIDTGTNDGCPAHDEQGKHRPLDGDGDSLAVCDVGAYEAWPINFFENAVYLPLVLWN
jgi:CSLREA domain-containing protein